MMKNQRVGFYYLASAMGLCYLGLIALPLGLLLWWPALSLFVISMGYFGLGASVYAKTNGHAPQWSRWLHWFTRCGQEFSRRHYAKQCDTWNELTEFILIGRQLTSHELSRLDEVGVSAILDLTAEFKAPAGVEKFSYKNIPILDLTAPSAAELADALSFISTEAKHGKVYVHCKIGYSRTAAIVGCYLLDSSCVANANEAIHMLRSARPPIVIRPEAEQALRNFEQPCHPS